MWSTLNSSSGLCAAALQLYSTLPQCVITAAPVNNRTEFQGGARHSYFVCAGSLLPETRSVTLPLL